MDSSYDEYVASQEALYQQSIPPESWIRPDLGSKERNEKQSIIDLEKRCASLILELNEKNRQYEELLKTSREMAEAISSFNERTICLPYMKLKFMFGMQEEGQNIYLRVDADDKVISMKGEAEVR